jgi:uncharacterized protein
LSQKSQEKSTNNLHKPKKILLIGSTGRVGGKVLELSLEFGFVLNLLVRNQDNLSEKIHSDKNITTIVGNVLQLDILKSSMIDCDYIISTLSARKTKPDYSILSEGMKNIIESMKINSINRLIVVSGAGVLDDIQYGKYRDRPNYPQIFRSVSQENLKVLELLEKSKIDYTMICAPEMPFGELSKEFRVGIDFMPDGGRRISVEDVAFFSLKCLEDKEYFRKKIGIAY